MAPRFRRLASTISRAGVVGGIGGGGASVAAFSDGAVVRFGFWFMANLCQQTSPMPRFPKSLTMSSICHSLGQTNEATTAPKPRREEVAMNITQRDRDLGNGYAMRPPATRTELTEVGRSTPMGELLRRYWHPIGLVADATDVPRKFRVLGEDLILFRDRHGPAGRTPSPCCPRRTTPGYGKVEEDGIRCCYHGWKFDGAGHCLEQPREPDRRQFRDKLRHPSYPPAAHSRPTFPY